MFSEVAENHSVRLLGSGAKFVFESISRLPKKSTYLFKNIATVRTQFRSIRKKYRTYF